MLILAYRFRSSRHQLRRVPITWDASTAAYRVRTKTTAFGSVFAPGSGLGVRHAAAICSCLRRQALFGLLRAGTVAHRHLHRLPGRMGHSYVTGCCVTAAQTMTLCDGVDHRPRQGCILGAVARDNPCAVSNALSSVHLRLPLSREGAAGGRNSNIGRRLPFRSVPHPPGAMCWLHWHLRISRLGCLRLEFEHYICIHSMRAPNRMGAGDARGRSR